MKERKEKKRKRMKTVMVGIVSERDGKEGGDRE